MTTTDRGVVRRRLAGLVLLPVAAGIFGASVAWAVETDPRAEADDTAAQVAEARARIDALADRITAGSDRKGVGDEPAAAPPPVDVVTGASG